MSNTEQILIEFILHHFHWCPFSDDCGINFDQECVGFREAGCKYFEKHRKTFIEKEELEHASLLKLHKG